MTAYLTYESIAQGNLKPDQTVPISREAWHTGGSRMFISPSQTVTVNDLLHGLIIDSGNDSAVALAQAVAGTRESFVQMMNAAAAKLDLTGTHYTDVDGLPDPQLRTTALDVATLSRAIIARFPQYLKISVKKHYTWDKITQRSWNPVLFRDPTVDGLKTGRTDEAGHCIDATALRAGRRLIAVVLGGPSWHASTNAIEALLDYGYRFYDDRTLATVGKPVGALSNARLQPETVPVGPAHDVVLTVPAHGAKSVKTALQLDKPGVHGLRKGERVGSMTVLIDGKALETVPVVALADARPAGFVTRIVRGIKKLL
jgi:D-alanyl-D-alanine carboxypeptidase (penicillin-binding protein 5/6)